MPNILEKINEPKDLRQCSIAELNTLAEEIRECIIKKVDTVGGHLGPNLGFVEPTIAMHYVFNTPKDKFVFDVSHQCYPHKILTGRKEYYTNPEKYHEISGYTNPKESEHDSFFIGHTSTSVSLSVGLAKARDLKREKSNIVAVIGDGSLSGGEAFEGLDNAAALGSNIIIVVNDNDMSIAPNYGGIYGNLQLLKETGGKAECNFFKAMGFDYRYVADGNNVEKLIKVFEEVKDIDHPVVVHLHTLKGKGLPVAEQNKEAFHWIMPGTVENFGKSQGEEPESYNSITKDFLLKKREKDNTVIAISPATPGVYGFTPDFREKLGEGYTDVGICEEHAIAYSSGLAANGAKPVLSIMSSFIQRTYDQLSQDLALNSNPATILVWWGGISGGDATHLGCFDIPLVSNIPNIVYLSPAYKEEYLKMLDWSVEQTQYPVAIRVPFGNLESCGEDNTDYSILNKFKVEVEGKDIAIIGAGNFLHLGKKVLATLKEKFGINATLINPRFISGLDKELLENLKQSHKLVITLEDGVKDGGFGEKVASFYGNSDIKVLNYGAEKEFTDRVPLEELYQRYHLTPELIAEDVAKTLNL